MASGGRKARLEAGALSKARGGPGDNGDLKDPRECKVLKVMMDMPVT